MADLTEPDGFGFWTEHKTKVNVNTTGDKRPILCDWIKERCTGKFYLYGNCIFFQKEEDAIIFKLRFC